jgi:hypothetical protein
MIELQKERKSENSSIVNDRVLRAVVYSVSAKRSRRVRRHSARNSVHGYERRSLYVDVDHACDGSSECDRSDACSDAY